MLHQGFSNSWTPVQDQHLISMRKGSVPRPEEFVTVTTSKGWVNGPTPNQVTYQVVPSKTPESDGSGQSLYKTELCRSFEETGTCRYGNKCQFAHGKAELRPVARHPKYKTEVCKTFYTVGTCPYGKRCRFIHTSAKPAEELQVLSPVEPTSPGVKVASSSLNPQDFVQVSGSNGWNSPAPVAPIQQQPVPTRVSSNYFPPVPQQPSTWNTWAGNAAILEPVEQDSSLHYSSEAHLEHFRRLSVFQSMTSGPRYTF